MVAVAIGGAPKKEAAALAAEEAPTFEKVSWYKEPGLRKLYFYAFVLCIASATTGYDGYARIIQFTYHFRDQTNLS